VSIGKSIAADRRTKSKTKVKSGFGDRGDVMPMGKKRKGMNKSGSMIFARSATQIAIKGSPNPLNPVKRKRR